MDKIKRCADALYKKLNKTERSLYVKGRRSSEKAFLETLAREVINEFQK